MNNSNLFPILSICIPTYNRSKILYKNLKQWLQSDNKDFEIVVSDNNSNDVSLLEEIKDTRFKLIKQKENTGTYVNGFSALNNATGKYIMQLMDKDLIKMDNINVIIDILKQNDIAAGCFIADYNKDKIKFNKYTSKFKNIKKYCSKGNHPSGFFFNRELFKKKKIYETLDKYNKNLRAYTTDFITTLLCDNGDFCRFYVPFVYLEKPPFKDILHSHTYSPEKGNVFFIPTKRFEVFETYIDFLKEIKLSDIKKFFLAMSLSLRMLIISSIGYIKILNQKNICDWYNLSDELIKKEKEKNLCAEYMKRLTNTKIFGSSIKHKIILLYVMIFYIPVYILYTFYNRHRIS